LQPAPQAPAVEHLHSFLTPQEPAAKATAPWENKNTAINKTIKLFI
jgi:hypothetical protein